MKNKIKTLLIASVVLLATACSGDWLDVNQNPNVPTEPNIAQLLTRGQMEVGRIFGQGNFIGNRLSTYTHHMTSRDEQNYGMMPGANNPQNTWVFFYQFLMKNFQKVIEIGDEEGDVLYSGIARTLLAFAATKMVDLFGDIPFSEALDPENHNPRPDRGEDIYNAAFQLLDEALANFRDTDAANILRPGSDDVFFGGNIEKWIRLNNTIQLQLLLNTRNARSYIPDWQSRLTALMNADNFMRAGEDFEFWWTTSRTPEERHPAFVAWWINPGQNDFISPFFYEMMMGMVDNNRYNPFAGIQDPRVPYFFFRPLRPGETTPVQHSYRHGTFLSIFFADIGPNEGVGQLESMTRPGLWVAGGRFDDGEGRVAGQSRWESAGPQGGVAPTRLLSYHSFRFKLAELALVGAITGDARAHLQAGMEAAIAHVNRVAARHSAPLISGESRDAFVTAVLGRYDSATTDAARLEIIMTQKWIGNFFFPTTAYTDFRRTGFPVLFDPANTSDPGWGVNLVINERSPARVPIQTIASFPRVLFYPQVVESGLNQNLPQRTNLSLPTVFWDR